MPRTSFHSPKDVRAIGVGQYYQRSSPLPPLLHFGSGGGQIKSTRKGFHAMCERQKPRAICAYRKLPEHSLFLLMHSILSIDPVSIKWVTPSENVFSGMCRQRRPRSACASAQSDQGFRCPQTESLLYYRMFQLRANARMRFYACAGWCESTKFGHAWRHIFAWRAQIVAVVWLYAQMFVGGGGGMGGWGWVPGWVRHVVYLTSS